MNACHTYRMSLLAILAAMLIACLASASEDPVRFARHDPFVRGLPAESRAARDTVYLLGGPDRWDGRFEDPDGQPNWHGWTSEDWTVNSDEFWHVSPFQAVSGQYSMWCGTDFDGDPGYGNSWDQRLVFTHRIDDPGVATGVRLQFTLQNDSEPGYDYTYVEWNAGGTWILLSQTDGVRTVTVDEVVIYEPGQYVGEAGEEIQLRIRFNSDGAWSDEDGLWNTNGACQVDDVTVTMDGMVVDHEDFEDQVSDRWHHVPAASVGDFVQLIHAPGHTDPCRDNDTWMVCFIDDGVVVPGTGGSTYEMYPYGPGGYVVNWTGGLAGPDFQIDNHVISPAIEAPTGFAGASLAFDAWRDNSLVGGVSMMFIEWHVRSTSADDPAELENAEWLNHDFLYYGGPDFHRLEFMLHEQLVPDARWFQVSLGVWEYPTWGWVYGASPAPYFDNVAVKMFDFEGPSVAALDYDLPSDQFPQQGHLDLANLASNSCRFDPVVAGGDSVAFIAQPLDPDAVLAGPPTMQVRLRANPLFDGVRQLPADFSREGDVINGVVLADSCREPDGDPIPHRWFVDLPDEGLLFPGDELHVFIAATDLIDGAARTSLMPADTSGFSTFAAPGAAEAYDPAGVVRFLPSVADAAGQQPPSLLWNDADPTRTAWWARRLAEAAGLEAGVDYDVFTTRSKINGLDSGLGQAATPEMLTGYQRIFYTSGDAKQAAMAVDSSPAANLDLLGAWLDTGGDLLLSGDGWAGDLADDDDGATFVEQRAGVLVGPGDQTELLDGQTSPRAVGLAAGGVFPAGRSWLLSGNCPDVRRFDILEPATAVALADYLNPDGNGGIYQYTAATLRQDPDTGSQVIALSWDLETAGGGGDGTGAPTAAVLLRDILAWFGQSGVPLDVGELPGALAVSVYPNPFNPRTSIRLDLPRATSARVRLYDLRGAVVRTLHEGSLAAGRHEMSWRGDDDRGRALASGVYFYEVQVAGDRRLGKLTLVR